MTGQEKIARGYVISVRSAAPYHVLYAPRVPQDARGNGAAPPQVPPPFEVAVDVGSEEVNLRWVNPPTDRDASQEDFESDALARVRTLRGWLARLDDLVRPVEAWAKELGWATRLIEKKLEDRQIGKYQAPALLMQEGTDRILLEPLGRSSIGTEGVVDLYLMPQYDDVATFYYYEGRWNLQSASTKAATFETVRDAPTKPLSKDALQEVLEELRQNAT